MSTLIDLDAAHAGMVLAVTLSDQRGATLLPSGCVLSDSMLASLRTRGIERLTVASTVNASECPEPSNLVESTAETSREMIEARLAFLFRRSGDAMCPFRQILTKWRLREVP